MSEWKTIKKSELELDEDEISFYTHSDDWGNHYAILKIKDLIDFLKENNLLTKI